MDNRPLVGPMGQAYLKSDEYGKSGTILCLKCMDIECNFHWHITPICPDSIVAQVSLLKIRINEKSTSVILMVHLTYLGTHVTCGLVLMEQDTTRLETI